MILSLAAGEVSEESLTRWIRDNWPPEAAQIAAAAGGAKPRAVALRMGLR